MKLVGILGVVALCALPAHGEQQALEPADEYALTPIDGNPTKEELVRIFPLDAATRLAGLARDPSADFGVRLRAVRSLPHFCPTGPCDDELPHATVVALIDAYAPSDHAGRPLLLLRAALETLGVLRSGDPNDVTRLVGFLEHASQDIRVAAARGLRDLCDPRATSALFARKLVEPEPQVQKAIEVALQVLGQCRP